MHEYPGCEDECVRECVCVCNGWTQDQNIIDSCDLCMLAVIGHSTAWSILRWPANRFGRCPWTRYQVKVNLMAISGQGSQSKKQRKFPSSQSSWPTGGRRIFRSQCTWAFFSFLECWYLYLENAQRENLHGWKRILLHSQTAKTDESSLLFQ